MIKTVKEAKEIAKKYNSLNTDLKRLAFLKEQKGTLYLYLDNDCTMVKFEEIDDEDIDEKISEINLNDFDKWHGWEDGVIELFEFAGIRAEQC